MDTDDSPDAYLHTDSVALPVDVNSVEVKSAQYQELFLDENAYAWFKIDSELTQIIQLSQSMKH